MCSHSAFDASSSARRDFPTPASPSTSSSDGPPRCARRCATLLAEQPELGLTTDEGGPVALGPVARRREGIDGPEHGHQLLTTLHLDRLEHLVVHDPSGGCVGGGRPTSTVPGAAAVWSRLAVFTTSPIAV